jgi:hypothetical protein
MSASPTLAVVVRPDAPERLELIRSIAAAELLPTWSFPDLQPLLDSDAVSADTIVVLQSWPDEFPSRQVCSLLAAAPLSRLIVATGPWCAGDGRTRGIWPAGVRVPVSDLTGRLRLSVSNRLAWTASRSEVFEHDYTTENKTAENKTAESRACDRSTLASRPRRVVLSVGGDRCYGEMLAGVLSRGGYEIVADPVNADVTVFDADVLQGDAPGHLTRRVALASIPSQALSRRLHAAGCSAVVWKLSPSKALLAAIDAA